MINCLKGTIFSIPINRISDKNLVNISPLNDVMI
jgi:hypothetical protein